ncbi:Hypothetical protein LUCI_1465 [Lucifera butyrica]|uniref:Uncharacterized protein n=1 Tax=Lucifera butyrica TaxID=1351585 RepID=A0A498R5Y0_9FIRM|nr:hypothetical protein [Lucifera butyrica]VBB06247.1 Hypothetical protein LUCI_1465 [Lucifera butyrica]
MKACSYEGRIAERDGFCRPGENGSRDLTRAGTQWETCQINYEVCDGKWGFYPREIVHFTAQAFGPRGNYCAGRSPEFEVSVFTYSGRPSNKCTEHNLALQVLADELIKENWQPLESGGHDWFSLRFRRLVK